MKLGESELKQSDEESQSTENPYESVNPVQEVIPTVHRSQFYDGAYKMKASRIFNFVWSKNTDSEVDAAYEEDVNYYYLKLTYRKHDCILAWVDGYGYIIYGSQYYKWKSDEPRVPRIAVPYTDGIRGGIGYEKEYSVDDCGINIDCCMRWSAGSCVFHKQG